jgi:nicotinamidase-related amidase
LLVLAEDWCGDASNTVPYVAKLGEQARCLEMRVLRRDEHAEVMDRYLTGTSRAIPIVIVLDEDWHEIGHWGSRPRELQAWVMEARRTTPKEQLYPQIRRWYARDKGETTLREILALLPSLEPAPSSTSSAA